MKRSEIMTLMSHGVAPHTIATAIIAGRLDRIISDARRAVDAAAEFQEGAEWSEVLRIMEGKLGHEMDQMVKDGNRKSLPKTRERDRF